MTALLVMFGGACGAVLRYLLDRWVRHRYDSAFPWGTLTVNVAGSALLGVLAGWALTAAQPDGVRALAGVGLCGSLTTFSTFGYETVRLFLARDHRCAVVNVVVTVLTGFGAGVGGFVLAAALGTS